MSFKNTVLPDFIIAELYEHSLIQTGTAAFVRSADVKSADIDPEPEEQFREIPGLEQRIVPSIAEDLQQEPVLLPYRFLGKNQKRISIITNYPGEPYIPEEHLQFLIKILSACKFNLADVAILNDSVAVVEINRLKKELNPAFVLLFGPGPSDIGLPLSFPLLKPQFFDGCNFLSLPPIAVLLEETDAAKGLKKQLWDCLKKMFSI
ncbi:MAG TPA: hypothetical protein VK616_05650 [Flavitalea sp.]|nr:hypothetical protein [Flavitalea sp.]